METITRETKGIRIELFCEPEDLQIEGNASAVDPVTDAATVAWIKGELASGNEWAWCRAHVRVTYKGILSADDYLGCCSYKSEADFREPGGYFDDMIENCLAEINSKRVQLCEVASWTSAEKDKQEAREELRARLKPGMEILCVLRHVSRSGMQRVIDLKVIEDGEIRGLGWTAARAMGCRYDKQRDGIVIGGAGMDMGFALVYDLGATLWPKGFDCIGLAKRGDERGCPSNDHGNREDNAHHRDGGYALRSRWI